MANEKKVRNAAKDHVQMSAAKKASIAKTQPRPAYVGMNCVGGGTGAKQTPADKSNAHMKRHPNDDQHVLYTAGVPRILITCDFCKQGFHNVNQVDQSLIKGKVIVTCHSCRDQGVNRRKSPYVAFQGVSLAIPHDFRESLSKRHSREKIEDAQDKYAHLAQKKTLHGPALRVG